MSTSTTTPTTTSSTRALAGKAAFVTGGSRGIGAAIVRRLAQGGASVAFTYTSNAAAANQLVASVEAAGGRALALHADSADAKALTAAVDEAARTIGRLDILVNNAGVALMGGIDSFSLEDFDRTLNVNVRAVFVALDLNENGDLRFGREVRLQIDEVLVDVGFQLAIVLERESACDGVRRTRFHFVHLASSSRPQSTSVYLPI